MAKSPNKSSDAFVRRKRRTRAHVIADLSVNHLERHVLRCGHAAEIVRFDYGLDVNIFFFDPTGEMRDGRVTVQLKASEAHRRVAVGSALAVQIDRRDLNYWLVSMPPVILVAYDAQVERGYWLYVQAHFDRLPGFHLSKMGSSITVRVPYGNVVDEVEIRQFSEFNDTIVWQGRRVKHNV